MEIIYHKGNKYSTKCLTCDEPIKFKINLHKFNISAICKNGHISEDISFWQFEYRFISKTNFSIIKCNRCFSLINENSNNFICGICKNILCNNCINIHSKEKKHNIRSNYLNKDKECQLHHKQYILFCYDCKKNLCKKCKEEHIEHCIKSYFDILPSNKEIKTIKNINKNYNEKIQKIIDTIKNYKKEVEERYDKIMDYLYFLANVINGKLIKEFNYSYFDYYNYENFKYCLNYLNNKEIIQSKNLLEYLISGNFSDETKLEDFSDDIKIIKEKNENRDNIINENKEIYKIFNYNSLQYLKNNYFMRCQKGFSRDIEIFEFNQYSFNHILTYNLKIFDRIKNIKPAKYSNDILINIDYKKNIKILQYDLKEKTFSYCKNEIRAIKKSLDKSFLDFIDDKNGNIITVDKNEISLWKKHNKIFGKVKYIKGIYDKLYNISDTIFCAIDPDDNIIYFINHENFQIIKSIYIKGSFEYIGDIQKELCCIKNQLNNNLLFIDLKYFDIVIEKEIKNDVDYVKIMDNYLLQFNLETDFIRIKKDIFIPKKKYFENKGLIEKNIDCSYSSNVSIIDDDYFIIFDTKNLSIFKI